MGFFKKFCRLLGSSCGPKESEPEPELPPRNISRPNPQKFTAEQYLDSIGRMHLPPPFTPEGTMKIPKKIPHPTCLIVEDRLSSLSKMNKTPRFSPPSSLKQPKVLPKRPRVVKTHHDERSLEGMVVRHLRQTSSEFALDPPKLPSAMKKPGAPRRQRVEKKVEFDDLERMVMKHLRCPSSEY